MARFEREQSEYIEKLVYLNRVSKTVKGGRVMKFSALMVVGDGKGKVGYGLGKAAEVPEAIRKGLEAAKKNMITVTMSGSTLKGLLQGVGGSQGHAVHIVDDLGIDVGLAAENVETGAHGSAGDLSANTLMTLHALLIGIRSSNHFGTPPYFLAPVLPTLRRMTSSVYLMPLPL